MVLAGAARGETESKGGGGPVRLSDVDTWELAGVQNELICHFMLAADVVGDGIWEFMNILGAKEGRRRLKKLKKVFHTNIRKK